MKRRTKQFMALCLAGSMILGTASVAYAAEPGIEEILAVSGNDGDTEAVVSQDGGSVTAELLEDEEPEETERAESGIPEGQTAVDGEETQGQEETGIREEPVNDEIRSSADTVDAVDTSWYKQEETEFTISTAAQLAGLAELVNAWENMAGKTIKLENDIDLSGIPDWTPIGSGIVSNNQSSQFEGIFDGNGKSVTGMTITDENARNYVGFFGLVNGGVVKDLRVSGNVAIPALENDSKTNGAGGMIGVASSKSEYQTTSIVNCSFEGDISNAKGKARSIGGIVGKAMSVVSIGNCSVHAKIDGGQSVTGGICGSEQENNNPKLATVISGCMVSGSVSGSGKYTGGIIGEGVGTAKRHFRIEACDISGDTQIAGMGEDGAGTGGIAGHVKCVEIDGCKVDAVQVSGNKSIGGIAGGVETADIRRCENHADINALGTGIAARAAGIVGYSSWEVTNIENCVNYGNVTAQGRAAGITADGAAADSRVWGCYNVGDVSCVYPEETATMYGAAGICYSDDAVSVGNCYNKGWVTGPVYQETGQIMAGALTFNCSKNLNEQVDLTNSAYDNTESISADFSTVSANAGTSVEGFPTADFANRRVVQFLNTANGESFWAQGEDYPCFSEGYIPVADLQLRADPKVLYKGETAKILAEITPAEATNRKVVYSGAKAAPGSQVIPASVVQVAPDGTVTALGKGKVLVEAVAYGGPGGSGNGITKSVEITVEEKIPVTGLTLSINGTPLSQNTYSMRVGDEAAFTAQVTPADATDRTVRYTSDAPDIVSVGQTDGKITAVAAGTAKITAQAQDGSGEEAVCTVTVSPRLAASVTVSPNEWKMKRGETKELRATVSPADASQTVKYTSSAADIVSVDEVTGLITANKPGEAVITAKAQDGSNETGECRVTVEKRFVENIGLELERLEMTVGDTAVLKAEVTPADAEDKSVRYDSSDPDVASVDAETGKITAVRAGTAVITVMARDGSGKKAECTVTVKAKTVQEPEKKPAPKLSRSSLTLYTKGKKTAELKVTVDGKKIDGNKAKWKTSDRKIIEVKNGKVTAKKAGKATVTVTVDGRSSTCSITVKKPSLKLSRKTYSVKKGRKVKIAAKATPSGKITYRSKNKKIATVNAKGVVKGKKKGTVKITVTCNGVKKTCKVRVR